MDKEIYIFRIICRNDNCILNQSPLDDCKPHVGLAKLYQKVLEFSTATKTLEVQSFSENSLDLLVFQWSHKLDPAHVSVTFIPEMPFAKKSISFVAQNFVDASDPPNSLLKKIEYIPIHGPPYQENIECPSKPRK